MIASAKTASASEEPATGAAFALPVARGDILATRVQSTVASRQPGRKQAAERRRSWGSVRGKPQNPMARNPDGVWCPESAGARVLRRRD